MKTYTFKIKGMTCHACESLIKMDLEDANLPDPASISAETGVMKIDLQEDQVEHVKQAIEATNKYTIESYE